MAYSFLSSDLHVCVCLCVWVSDHTGSQNRPEEILCKPCLSLSHLFPLMCPDELPSLSLGSGICKVSVNTNAGHGMMECSKAVNVSATVASQLVWLHAWDSVVPGLRLGACWDPPEHWG